MNQNSRNPYQILFAAPLFLAFLAVAFAALFWRQFDIFRDAYLSEVESELHFQCRVAANVIEKSLLESDSQGVRDFCKTYVGTPHRITVIAPSGEVLVDSNRSAAAMENHLKRPEIQKVLKTRTDATAIHYSETLQVWMIYFAQPVEVNDQLYVLRISVPMRPISSLLARVVWNIALALFVGTGLVTLLTFYIVFRLRLPLLKLQESAGRIAGGDLSAAVFVPRKGATRELALAVAEMAEQLRQRIGDLVKLESFRSDFVANVSHEIKTPLTGILSAVETMEDGAKDVPAMRDRCLDILSRQALRLHALVMDILSLAALEQRRKGGATQEDFTAVSAPAILKSAVTSCSEAARDAGITLEIVRQDDPQMVGNAQLLEQAVTNLIINAIRYSGSPRVELASEVHDERLVLCVRDFGIGIPEEHAGRIFERFYRVHKERSRELGGTGLGLAIVKHIVQLHGGHVELSSEPGKGAEFRLIFYLTQSV